MRPADVNGKMIDTVTNFEFPEVRIIHNDEDAAEWKATRAYPHIVYCPKCFNTYVSNREWIINGYIDKAEFCPHCGQPMSDDDGYLTYTGDDEEETEDGTAQ